MSYKLLQKCDYCGKEWEWDDKRFSWVEKGEK